MSHREDVISGLRQLADLLEHNPDVDLPYQLGGGSNITFMFLSGGSERERMARLARLIPGKLTKKVMGSGAASYFGLSGKIGGIKVTLMAYRDVVCERVVTGTREITEEVPDPDKLAEVPTISVTKTVEDVEWRCAPVLAGDER